ncbi:MAG: hypothetical protein AAGF12_02860 [Myxococcota bacterium]
MLRWFFLLTFLSLSVACGGDDTAVGDGSVDAATDALVDAEIDARTEGGIDASPDGSVDAARDAIPDSPPDSSLDAMPDANDCNSCLANSYRWAFEGGRRIETSASAIEACREFEHRRMTRTPPARTCSNMIPGCGAMPGEITVADILEALAHPDVVAAFAAAPVLYGQDGRPFDAPLFELTETGRRPVQVGLDCRGIGSCTPIPAGVEALRDLLIRLEQQQLTIPDCSTTFP